LDALVRVLTALVAATLVARVLVRYLCPTADPKLDPMGRGTARLLDLTAMLCIPAVVVGWQALIGVVLLAVLIAWRLRNRFSPQASGLSWFAVALPVAFSLQLLFWRPLEQLIYWPSSQSPPWVILLGLALLLVVPRGLQTVAPTIIATNDRDPRLEIHPAESD
jgi:leader peptidase (prepilin peptidase)/N-methyltransferase